MFDLVLYPLTSLVASIRRRFPYDLDGAPNGSSMCINRMDFLDNSKSSIVDCTADDILILNANRLTFIVWFRFRCRLVGF